MSNANLTAAYIEDWGITRNTLFDGVKGDYVYQKLPTKYNRDPNRMPTSQQGNFGKNDLYIFITSVLDTLDLYHRQNINAGVALTVLKGLTEDYPVQFELTGIEKRGDNQYVMKLKVFGQASHFQLQREYYARYEQTLPLHDPKRIMPDTENIVAKIIETVEENPGMRVESLHNNGIFITEGQIEKVDMSSVRNIKIGQGNYNENIEGDYIDSSRTQNISGGTINNSGAGAFSLGDISGTVANTINQLPNFENEPEKKQLKELLDQLQTAVKTAELDEEEKAESLEQVEAIALSLQNSQDGVVKKTVKKAMKLLRGTAAALPPGAAMVTICNQLPDLIAKIF